MSGLRSFKQVLVGGGLIATLTLSGCGPGMGPVGVTFAVRAPPRDQVEVVTTSPGPGYYWVRGHYAWQGGDYVWVAGSWQRPPEARYHRWVAGHWAHARGGYYWVEGHWA